jgi:anaerobic magnesium-protoporphyrin IX monomethyl ester cyclase
MRVLLINTNTRADLLAAPPIGAACVATAAAAAGHDVRLLDLCFARDRDKELAQATASFNPEVVGLSIRNLENVNLLHPVSYVDDARRVVDAVRLLTEAPVVLGGSGTSLCPAALLKELKADYVVAGDGEAAFVSLLGALAAGRAPLGIPGVGFFDGDTIRLSPPAFDDASFGNPGLDRWVDLKRYRRVGSAYTIQTKRGCCQNCIYCTYNQSLEGRGLRLRAPADVVAEIEQAVLRHGVREFDFVDSVFNEPPDHCREILDRIVRCSWKAEFTASGLSPRNVDRTFLKLLWDAGFRSFMMTPDSASESMLRSIGKGFGLEDLVSAATALDTTPFTVMWLFLIGGPGETHETIEETLAFVRRHVARGKRPPYTMAHFYFGMRVYPGTRLWDAAIRDGFIAPESDPLRFLWYVSPRLDLARAIGQLVESCVQLPEVSLAFDEKWAELSAVVTGLGKVLRMPKPYWRSLWKLNRLLIRTGLRRRLGPGDVAGRIRDSLEAQKREAGALRKGGRAAFAIPAPDGDNTRIE